MEPFFTSFTRKCQLTAARASIARAHLNLAQRDVASHPHRTFSQIVHARSDSLSSEHLGNRMFGNRMDQKFILFKTKCPHVSFGKYGN